MRRRIATSELGSLTRIEEAFLEDRGYSEGMIKAIKKARKANKPLTD
jgi:hypothetical protein